MRQTLLVIFVFYSGLLLAQHSSMQIAPIFGSNMVLPRGKTVPVTGFTLPNTSVQISIQNKQYTSLSDAQGNWQVEVGPLTVGDPVTMTCIGPDTIELVNILVGDLYLCAGQSNMEFTPEMLGLPTMSVDSIPSSIRLFDVDIGGDYQPQSEIRGGTWTLANPQTVSRFSAVGFAFGQALSNKVGVPIGLISSNLGATTIETWMSLDALDDFPQFEEVIRPMQLDKRSASDLQSAFDSMRMKWDEKYLSGPGIEGQWYKEEYDDSDWETCQFPIFWEKMGFPEHDGSMWFRRTFWLEPDQVNADFLLHLNQIDDYDRTYVNGFLVGETFGHHNFRSYLVPKSKLKIGENTIAVRVFDVGGYGGFYTNAFWGNPILNGTWKYKVGAAIDTEEFSIPTLFNASSFSHPSVLYHANIAPLHKLPISGVIWYQGEANVGRADEYRLLIQAMIRDWRTKWQNQTLPFYFVQLANHHKEDEQPKGSELAELREAQFAARNMPMVDVCTAIDIGDAYDIHPKNKKEVGHRLAQLALHDIYGKPYVNGPVYSSHEITDSTIVVSFETYDDLLKTNNKYGYINGFQIAGLDGDFQWARAHLRDNKSVVVYHPDISNPKYVRYAWSDNPGDLNLVNSKNMPVFPFRTDSFPLLTADKKYVYNDHGF